VAQIVKPEALSPLERYARREDDLLGGCWPFAVDAPQRFDHYRCTFSDASTRLVPISIKSKEEIWLPLERFPNHPPKTQ